MQGHREGGAPLGQRKSTTRYFTTLESSSLLSSNWNTIFSIWNSYFQKIFKNFKATAWYWALPHPITVANSVSQQLHTPRHHRSVGGNPQQEVYHPFRACHSSARSTLSSAFSSSFFHLAQWRSAISTALLQSQPACQYRQDTTPTAIPSPLITYTLYILFSLLLFLSVSFLLFPLPPPLFFPFPSSITCLSISFSVAPPFLFPTLSFYSYPLSAFPIYFPLLHTLSLFLSLSPPPTYGRKAAQAQGNGINFHSRLNLQSISLELNTLPPIRKSQGSISPFPRRHSPAIQRQPCLTFWRCIGWDWTRAPACCSFLQAVQTSKNLRTTKFATFDCDAHLYLWHNIQIQFLHLCPVDT